MKLEALSDMMTEGHPLLATNLLSVAKKASVVRSLTSSTCVVLVAKHTKMARILLLATSACG